MAGRRTDYPGVDAVSVLDAALHPTTYEVHPLHHPQRTWQATNCYIDIWIEIVSHVGWPPQPAGLCALSADCLPREWAFLKYQTDDLRLLYGIHVAEIDVWRDVEDHVAEHLDVGNFVTLETDSWFLPDTEGISYRSEHTKTTIVPVHLDRHRRELIYFHNAGLYQLSGNDFDGALARPGTPTHVPMPYMELVRFDRADRDEGALAERARLLARDHLARRPADNPVARLATIVTGGLPVLAERGMAYFHAFSFATTRQLGLTAQNAADGLEWLADASPAGVNAASARDAAGHFHEVSEQAKKLQFALARAASGRSKDLSGALGTLRDTWAAATDHAVRALP